MQPGRATITVTRRSAKDVRVRQIYLSFEHEADSSEPADPSARG